MGSFISIVNSTQEDWLCKMGYDEVALKIGILIASIVAVIAVTIAAAAITVVSGGAGTPLLTAALGGGTTAVLGVSTTALGTIGAVVGAVTKGVKIEDSVSTFSFNIAKGIADKLTNEEFVLIPAGQKHSWKRTLSLWQQGTCVQTTIVDESTVKTRTLYMRPIFSGSTVNSNRDHDIQWWINKHGTKDEKVIADPKTTMPPQARVIATSNNDVPASFLQPVANAAVPTATAGSTPMATAANLTQIPITSAPTSNEKNGSNASIEEDNSDMQSDAIDDAIDGSRDTVETEM